MNSIKKISPFSDGYPQKLKKLDFKKDIYYLGDIKLADMPSVGVVGTRAPTLYGKQAAGGLVGELSKKLVVVSGLAYGVDSFAHQFCLDSRGRTVAVLAHGLDSIHPGETWDWRRVFSRRMDCLSARTRQVCRPVNTTF